MESLPTPSKPGERDIAEFFALALRLRVLEVASVRAWADGLIMATDIPPPWMIDISLCDQATAIECLQGVPGHADARTVYLLISAYLGRRWRLGTLETTRLGEAGAALYYGLPLDQRSSDGDWCICLEYKLEGRVGGWEPCSDEALELFVRDQLAPFATLEGLLPAEVLDGGTAASRHG